MRKTTTMEIALFIISSAEPGIVRTFRTKQNKLEFFGVKASTKRCGKLETIYQSKTKNINKIQRCFELLDVQIAPIAT